MSFILPHKFLVADFGVGIRSFFKSTKAVKSLVHFGSEMVFEDATTYTCIVNLDKQPKGRFLFKKIKPQLILSPFRWDYSEYENFSSDNWNLQNQGVFDLMKKLDMQPFKVADVFTNIFQGLATSADSVYVFEGNDQGTFISGYNRKYDYRFEIEKELVKPFVKGDEIDKYGALENTKYVLFPYHQNGDAVREDYIQKSLPLTYAYLKRFEKEIRGRERGKMDISEGWFLYIYPKSLTKFRQPKIMTQEISLGCKMTYDDSGEYYHPTTIYSFVKNDAFDVDEKFYLGILNSKVMWFFLKNTGTELRGGYFRFKTNYLKPFPLPKIPQNADDLVYRVNTILSETAELQGVLSSFLSLLASKFHVEKPSKKLQTWPDLDFKGFLAELKKVRVHLSLEEEAEWLTYFNKKKTEANALQAEIDRIDKQIDQMVYELYGLNEEEVRIVEQAS